MAFKLCTNIGNGYTAEYWRINEIVKNRLLETVAFRPDAYKDKATRMENVKALAYSQDFVAQLDVLQSGDDYADLYDFAKTLEQFQGAESI